MATYLENLNTRAAAATGRKKQKLELRAARLDSTLKRTAARAAVRAVRTASGAAKTTKKAAAAPIVLAARQACKTSIQKRAALFQPLPSA
jgi:hypothetical protein